MEERSECRAEALLQLGGRGPRSTALRAGPPHTTSQRRRTGVSDPHGSRAPSLFLPVLEKQGGDFDFGGKVKPKSPPSRKERGKDGAPSTVSFQSKSKASDRNVRPFDSAQGRPHTGKAGSCRAL